MKKIHFEKEELIRIIDDLNKASLIFDGFGCSFWDMLSKNEVKRYGEAEVLLTTSIKKLKNWGISEECK
jgi:hypothetical protein